MPIDQIFEIVKFGLSKESSDPHDANKTISIRDVKLLNSDTIVCEFFPYASDSIGIKTEIGFITSFLESFFRDNPLTPKIENFGVRAFDKNNQEILYALSSKKAARSVADGQAIEWLKNTIFEDNSDDHRLQQAKRKISEIEQGLRKIICKILKEKDNSWWKNCINKKIRTSAENFYKNQKGTRISDGEKLIEYTYLLQIKTIITDNWTDFNLIFSDKVYFENSIKSLNKIRRNEAHNRPITHENIKDLKIIYTDLLGSISNIFPEVIPKFLIDNWRIRLKTIVDEYFNASEYIEDGKKYSLNEIIPKIKDMVTHLKNAEIKLNSVVVPPGKEELHKELINVFNTMRTSFEDMMKGVQNGDMNAFEEAHANNITANEMVKKYTQKILMTEQ